MSAPVPITQRGEQITLNGRAFSIPWSQRQERFGITDAGFIQTIGVDLLNTDEVSQQPIAWFSDQQVSPIILSTWLSEQYRYLDITELAQRFGWQVQVNGSSLQISTPAAKVTGVRQGRQSWGDRIVVDLDQATPWQLNEQPGETIITIEAQIDPALIQSFKGNAGNRITSLTVETSDNRTVIRVGIPAGIRPRVWAIPEPNRLLIDVRPDSLAEREIQWAPGIRWRQQFVSLGADKFPVVSLEINPRQPGVTVKPIVSNASTLIGTAPLSSTAQQIQVVAAINGGFFNRNTQMPLGAIRRENRWVSGPILDRGAIAWNDSGEVSVGRLSLQETIVTSNGQQFPVLFLNSGFIASGICRHTSEWGSSYTNILDHEILVTVQDNKVINQQRTNAAGQTTVPIPSDGYLLVIRDDTATANALTPGTPIQLETATQPAEFANFAQILGAGPLLIQNGQIVLNAQAEQFNEGFRQQAAPRSVILTTAEGNLMLVTVHNRVNGLGPTLTEVAQLMQKLGAIHALNLDGGSSTTLYLGGQLIDRSSSSAARVHNGIGVFIQP
ncbi:MAG: phosphodiester glycosidase family protein [Cyanobacteria bacterium CRU_2_1]|nr:phosphodiester glycosidase family protein [Cyanobacteria bacterium RU_5_0]NJR58353.1 phosphodiester glycosidase family protein [Cyanobacteria bacterium CRU_2_1]